MELILPREKHAMETKAQLYNSMKKLLNEYDFKYVTVRNICEQANCTYGAFYYHFKSKEAMLSEYGRDLFTKQLEEHPIPDTIHPLDFVKWISWYLREYAEFCESMGAPVIKYIYENCESDIFYDVCFDENVRQVIDRAYKAGYIVIEPERLAWISEDIRYIYTGAVREWSSRRYSHEGLSVTDVIKRLTHRFVRSFASEKYFRHFPVGNLKEVQEISTNKPEYGSTFPD